MDSKNTILEKLFSNTIYKDIDTTKLVDNYNSSEAIERHNIILYDTTKCIIQSETIITEIPPEGLIINEPGIYILEKDIKWTPTSSASAITIQSSNVTLNLNNKTINAILNNISLDIIGITTKSNSKYNYLENITIKNGTLKDMSYYGICCDTINNVTINNIIIDGLNYINFYTPKVTPCGIFINNSKEIEIDSCTVQHINVTSASCAGVQIIKSEDVLINKCMLNNFNNNDGAVQGFSYLLSSNINTNYCSASNFRSHYLGITNTTGHTVIGYVPIFCIDLTFSNCSSNNFTGCCDDCHGMSVFIDALVEVNNFTATNITDGVSLINTGAKATGLEVYGVGVTIIDSIAENIKAINPQDKQGAGFTAWGYGNTFINCSSINVTVVDQFGIGNSALGYGVGFGWAPDPRVEFRTTPAGNTKYINCSASLCQVGFDTWFHQNSVWENISSTACDIDKLIEPDGTRTLSISKCSESPNGMLQEITLKNIAKDNKFI